MALRYKQITVTAMPAAALMLAHQVAGRAVRDSFFPSNYPASELPKIVIAAAVTILLVLLFARAMGRFGPQRLVPGSFLVSALLHGVEYRVMGAIRRSGLSWSISTLLPSTLFFCPGSGR